MTQLKVHTYTAAEPGLFVNSYLLEIADGVVLVDAGLLVSDARALGARAEALRKPLVAAFVTHPHPDHFNELPYVVADDVPVYATSRAAKIIEDTAIAKREQWQPTYGPKWPDRRPGLRRHALAVAAEFAADLTNRNLAGLESA